MDLPLNGATFTWTKNQECPSLSKLDRFLISANWEEHFFNVLQEALLRPILDHIPILRHCGGIKRRPSPFQIENMWLEDAGFLEKVASWRSSFSFQGKASHVFWLKVKALKEEVRKWNKEQFWRVDLKKMEALEA